MSMLRRTWLIGLAAAAALVVGCATAPAGPTAQERAALAPTGKLRVGVYPDSPTSLVKDKNGNKVGVAYELGQQLARRMGVPFEPVEYRRIAEVVSAMQKGEVDFTFTNATAARAQILSFTPMMLHLELGYLVGPGSTLQTIADVDQPNRKVAVIEGGTTAGVLAREFKNAKVVPVASPKAAGEQLAARQVDTFTTNKGMLFELADGMPGARVLDGRWGLENMAIGIPKGREAGLPYLNRFAQDVRSDGTMRAIVGRAGLRGTVEP